MSVSISKFKQYFFAAILLLSFSIAVPSYAQIVNSGASSTSSNSQVTLTATVPTVVIVKVDTALSKLSTSISPNVIDSTSNPSGQDFIVNGSIISNNSSANIQTTLSDVALKLVNGTSTITVNLSGTIGGKTISKTAFSPNFVNRSASIQIIGDLDETTVTSKNDPGNYTGSLTITATVQ